MYAGFVETTWGDFTDQVFFSGWRFGKQGNTQFPLVCLIWKLTWFKVLHWWRWKTKHYFHRDRWWSRNEDSYSWISVLCSFCTFSIHSRNYCLFHSDFTPDGRENTVEEMWTTNGFKLLHVKRHFSHINGTSGTPSEIWYTWPICGILENAECGAFHLFFF